ncbi:lysoplasmalogenase [Flavobacterium sp. W21_SRS_FM6]|uniref:lysoplasmalogenase n=1 Tax=Flavobacterium sp. W21_SRS_FM6 TaxID=3240268 RepID=UPI003F8EF775
MNIRHIRLIPLFYWLLALCYIIAASFYHYPLQAMHKAAPILFLAIMTIKGPKGRIRLWLTLALIASATGDILLASALHNRFIFGLIAFAIAHLCYAIGFIPWAQITQRNLLKALPLIGILVIILYVVLPQTAQLKLPVIVYMLIISAMALLAIFAQTHGLYLLSGAYLFVISDSLIALNKFVIALPAEHLLVMSTYYVAQYCLFTGCMKQEKTHVI